MPGPFDDFEDSNNNQEVVSVTSSNSSDGNKVRVTLKGGKGYDAPWITVDGTDIPDALTQLEDNAESLLKLIELTQKVGTKFGALAPASAAPAQSAPAQRQPVQQQAPNGESKTCAHGEMTYRAGFSKASGKPYKGFFCPERDRDQQCPPVFVR